MAYNTASRKRILEFLKASRDRTVSAGDIERYLKEEHHEVNLSTIYRYLDRLSQDGTLIKYTDQGANQAVYQYIDDSHKCMEHLHLQCVECGQIIHLECGFMKEITGHIQTHHGFTIQCCNSIIYGVCDKCKEKFPCECDNDQEEKCTCGCDDNQEEKRT